MADPDWRPSPSGRPGFYDECSHTGCKKKAWHNDGHLCCSPGRHQLEHAAAEQRRAERARRAAGIPDPIDPADVAAVKFGLLGLVGFAAFALYEAWRDRRR